VSLRECLETSISAQFTATVSTTRFGEWAASLKPIQQQDWSPLSLA